MYKEHKKLLRKITAELCKGVHAEGCLYPEACPELHIECTKHLNVETAIAWALKSTVELHAEESCSTKEFNARTDFVMSLTMLSTARYDLLYSIAGRLHVYKSCKDFRKLMSINLNTALLDAKLWREIRHGQAQNSNSSSH